MKNELQFQTTPFPLSQVRLLDGIFKERQETHARYLMMIEPDRMLAPFRRQAGLPLKAENYGGWEARDIAGTGAVTVRLTPLVYLMTVPASQVVFVPNKPTFPEM